MNGLHRRRLTDVRHYGGDDDGQDKRERLVTQAIRAIRVTLHRQDPVLLEGVTENGTVEDGEANGVRTNSLGARRPPRHETDVGIREEFLVRARVQFRTLDLVPTRRLHHTEMEEAVG